MLDTCHMKDYIIKNWFQQTNKDITHLQTTNEEENSGTDDASVVSDADVVVASAMSGRSEAKS